MSGGVDFNVLEFFKEEIANDTAAIRIEAVNNLNLIASALGPQKTVSELIPYLVQAIDEEKFRNDEEFLCKVATGLGQITKFMNGNQLEILIPPLESLAAQEETVIRTSAVDSLCSIVKEKPDLTSKFLVPCLHRLATKTDFFTARVSACSLFPTAYQFADEDQKAALRKAFVTICSDETPMVRRAAANLMTDFARVCDKQSFLADLIVAYKQLSQEDTQDSIRVACVNTTIELAQKFNTQENLQHTVSVINDGCQDRSWRVRLTVAKEFPKLCKAFGSELLEQLLDCHRRLLRDQEFEVRKESLLAIEVVIKERALSPSALMDLLLNKDSIHLETLQEDSAQQVRAALAKLMGPLAQALGKDQTQQHLSKIIISLMKDEYHDVRLNIVGHSGDICEVLTPEIVAQNNLLHTIQSLIMDNHWRIRETVVSQVPKLARLFGVDMFQNKLEALFISSLRDSVFWVRKCAISHLEELVGIFGPQWTVEHLMPKILDQYSQSAGYANRMTTLMALPSVCVKLTPEQASQYVLPLLLKATRDSVPNVRFCACERIVTLIKKGLYLKSNTQEIKSTLQELTHDSDCDVQYHAQLASKEFENN